MGPKSKDPSGGKPKAPTPKDSKDSKKKGSGSGAGAAPSSGKGAGKLKPATSINVRHILCEKHSRKEEALSKLNEGTDFATVARDYSEDKARQGGSLGWKTRGSLLLEFEKVAYELEPSTTAKPKWGEVKTSEGYHVVMVEGRK